MRLLHLARRPGNARCILRVPQGARRAPARAGTRCGGWLRWRGGPASPEMPRIPALIFIGLAPAPPSPRNHCPASPPEYAEELGVHVDLGSMTLLGDLPEALRRRGRRERSCAAT